MNKLLTKSRVCTIVIMLGLSTTTFGMSNSSTFDDLVNKEVSKIEQHRPDLKLVNRQGIMTLVYRHHRDAAVPGVPECSEEAKKKLLTIDRELINKADE